MNYVFLALVFGLTLGFGVSIGFEPEGFFFAGCFPKYASFIASISLSLYNPTGPRYLKGFIFRLLKRILTASGVIFKILPISEADIPSIYISIATNFTSHQVNSLKRCNSITLKNICIKMTHIHSQNDTILTKFRFFIAIRKKIKFFIQNLDNPISPEYLLI